MDPKGYISRVEFFANDKSIGVSEMVFIRAPDPGTPIKHMLDWNNVPAGKCAYYCQGQGFCRRDCHIRPGHGDCDRLSHERRAPDKPDAAVDRHI